MEFIDADLGLNSLLRKFLEDDSAGRFSSIIKTLFELCCAATFWNLRHFSQFSEQQQIQAQEEYLNVFSEFFSNFKTGLSHEIEEISDVAFTIGADIIGFMIRNPYISVVVSEEIIHGISDYFLSRTMKSKNDPTSRLFAAACKYCLLIPARFQALASRILSLQKSAQDDVSDLIRSFSTKIKGLDLAYLLSSQMMALTNVSEMLCISLTL
jgi:hypothetical protein